jgi:hypothetical protein
MSNFGIFTWLVCVLGIIFAALMPALVAHFAFLRSLATSQPDLWHEYRRIAFTFEHFTTKHQKLTREVYARISAPSVVRARRRETICWRIFATVLLLASLSLGVSRLLEFL